jgi:ribosome-associated toxin RatA of RatAB toxin-antitoxin module
MIIKVSLIVLALLLAACGMVYVMGSRQPLDHTAAVRAHLRASPDSLYKIVTDVLAYPSWRPGVTKVELLPPRDGHVVWRETSRQGALEYEFTETSPPTRAVSTLVSTGAGFTGRWRFRFLADSSGTNVDIMEEGRVQNPVFRFAMRYVFGMYSSLEAYTKALAARTGESVTVERVP